MAKQRRKYDPSRQRNRLEKKILSTTFFYHGGMMESPGALCGNLTYPLTDAAAAAILSRKNTWAGVAMAFCADGNGTPYTKPAYFSICTPVSRAELDARVDREQTELLEKMKLDHVKSVGYYIVPDHQQDLASLREEITQLFERENPYDYTVTVLACMVRESNKHQEAA